MMLISPLNKSPIGTQSDKIQPQTSSGKTIENLSPQPCTSKSLNNQGNCRFTSPCDQNKTYHEQIPMDIQNETLRSNHIQV